MVIASTAAVSCQDSSGAQTVTAAFGTDDRFSSGYTYDPMGRVTKMPKAHTDQAGVSSASDLTATYRTNDMVASLTQTVQVDDSASTVQRKQDFTLDASNRISKITDSTAGVWLRESTNHYDESSDSPAWTETKTRPDASTAPVTSWERYIAGPAGDLSIVLNNAGEATAQFTNLHGDVIATAVAGEAGLASYGEYTEYGLSRDGDPGADRYGWLGGKQRHSAGILGGLTLMGARLYSPETGRFLSRDPVPGGNENTYIYPADPINMFDLDGNLSWRKAGKWVKKNKLKIASYAATAVCVAATVGACSVAAVAVTALSGVSNYKRWKKGKLSARRAIASTAWDGLGVGLKGLRAAKAQRVKGKTKAIWVTTSHRLAAKRHKARYAARAIYSVASIYKTHKGG